MFLPTVHTWYVMYVHVPWSTPSTYHRVIQAGLPSKRQEGGDQASCVSPWQASPPRLSGTRPANTRPETPENGADEEIGRRETDIASNEGCWLLPLFHGQILSTTFTYGGKYLEVLRSTSPLECAVLVGSTFLQLRSSGTPASSPIGIPCAITQTREVQRYQVAQSRPPPTPENVTGFPCRILAFPKKK